MLFAHARIAPYYDISWCSTTAAAGSSSSTTPCICTTSTPASTSSSTTPVATTSTAIPAGFYINRTCIGSESFNAQQCAPCTSKCQPGFELNLTSAICDGSGYRDRICVQLPTTSSVAPTTSATAVLSSSTPKPSATTTTTPFSCLRGEFIGSNITNPVTCYPCKHGAAYHCGQGSFRNGTACDGTGVFHEPAHSLQMPTFACVMV